MKLTTIIFIIAVMGFVITAAFVFRPQTVTSSSISSTPVPTVANANRCVITIDNQQYDVTNFRDQHSGGDVFDCGTDMSSVFHGKHGAKELRYMARYKISN